MQKSRSKMLMTLQHMRELSEEELQDILMWVDSVPLTMDKKNLARDFSDGGWISPFLCIVAHIYKRLSSLRLIRGVSYIYPQTYGSRWPLGDDILILNSRASALWVSRI